MENDPLHGVDDVDWKGLAPDRGGEIPGLLRELAQGDEALSALHDIIHFPAPGHLAAPAAVGFLARIACDPQTPATDRWRPLSLLLELVAPHAEDKFPAHRELALWREEVAWITSTDQETVRAQYRAWITEAPDEQRFHRMANRAAVLDLPQGPRLLQAELDTYEAVREHIPDLVGLLRGSGNRGGVDRATEWTCYLLAFFPEDADRIVPAITAASQLLTPKDLRAAPQEAASSLREMREMLANPAAEEPVSAELFALGMLAPPDDPEITVALAHQMAGGHLYNGFAAAIALAVIHGERTPLEAVVRAKRAGASRVGYPGLFGDSWPHCGERSPQELGFLALAAGGERTRALRLDMFATVLEQAEGSSRAVVAGAGLEMALGPRSTPREAESHASADYGEDVLKVLWSIAELPDSAWEDEDLCATLRAWALPDTPAAYRELVGAEIEDPGAQEAEEPRPDTPAPPPSGRPAGLFGRLFGGSG